MKIPHTFRIALTILMAWFGAASSLAQQQFVLISDASSLRAGDQVVIANAENNVAMSVNQKSNNRDQATVSISGNTLTTNDDVQVFTLELSENGWRFRDNDHDGWLTAGSSSKNILTTSSTEDDNSLATITFNDGAATVTFRGSHTRNTLRYNKSASIFSCYAANSSVRGEIQLYRHDAEPVIPTAQVNSIGAFNALPDGTEASIYLSDGQNARVIHAGEDIAWVRDNSGTVAFYRFPTNPTMRLGQHVAGYITGRKETVDGLPVLKATAKTSTAWLIIANQVTEPNVDDENPTGILLPADGQHKRQGKPIYNIGGIYKGTKTDALGQGLYVIDGQKRIITK